MFCPECGTELPDGTRFCRECGEPCTRSAVKDQRRSAMSAAETMAMPDYAAGRDAFGQQETQMLPSEQPTAYSAPAQPVFASQSTQVMPRAQTPGISGQASVGGQVYSAASPVAAPPEAEKRSNKKAIAAVILVLVAAAALIAAFLFKTNMDRQAADEAAHALRNVTFTIDAPNYNPATDSPIPLRVVGTDLDGNQVDSLQFIDTQTPVIQLAQGSYSLSVEASPMLADGTLYAVPNEAIDLQVRDNDLSGGDLSWSFQALEPADITDEMIEASYLAASQAGMPNGQADALRTAVVNARQAVYDAQQAEQERQAAQAEADAAEAAALDARRYSDGYVSLMVPASWVGNYRADTFGHTSGAFHTDFYLPGTTFILMRIDGMEGDVGSYTASYGNSAEELWYALHGQSSLSTSQMEQALYLQTGGGLSRYDVEACANAAEATAMGENYISSYLEGQIGYTIGAPK